jgi:predicted enzyme related to lactoylglutathione lyase
MSLGSRSGQRDQDVRPASCTPVVHLELHTGDLPEARALYADLCGWRAERIEAGCESYLALELGGGFGGGIVECQTERPLWLPYVEVSGICEVTDRARALGATVLLEPREGPAGWRSVVATAAGGEIAFWQAKERRGGLRRRYRARGAR